MASQVNRTIPVGGDPSGDGLPPSGVATRYRAEAVLAEDRHTLLAKFNAANPEVRAEPGRAWTRKADGTIRIASEQLATIVLTVRATNACPAEPQFWQGVPLSFA